MPVKHSHSSHHQHPSHQPLTSHHLQQQQQQPHHQQLFRAGPPGPHLLERKNTFPGCLGAHVSSQQQLSAVPAGQARRLLGSAASLANMQQKQQVLLAATQSPPSVDSCPPMASHAALCHSMSVTIGQKTPALLGEHKKLDRSMSEPAEKVQRQPSQANSSRYKTELCRPFEENGVCKYGDKCQFAHGMHELRNLQRHPKYKTELCRTFHTTGFCPYGPRCHFIHNSEETKKSVMSTLSAGFGPDAPNSQPSSSSSSSSGRSSSGQPRAHSGGNGANGNCAKSASAITSEMLLNGINTAMKSIVGKGPQNYSSPQPMRPKALSIGSFSMGSSGDLSPPSSQSGSPTSLNSFFNEDNFNGYSPLNSVSVSVGSANTAFSFSPPDFTSLIGNHSTNGGVFASQQQQARHQHLQLQEHDEHGHGFESGMGREHKRSSSGSESGGSSVSSGIGSASPPPALAYPGAPSSPVDSLGSELDMLSMNGSSPVPSAGSPPPPTVQQQSSKNGVLPRLPIFTRFANNGNNSD